MRSGDRLTNVSRRKVSNASHRQRVQTIAELESVQTIVEAAFHSVQTVTVIGWRNHHGDRMSNA